MHRAILFAACLISLSLPRHLAAQQGDTGPLIGGWKVVRGEFAGQVIPGSQLPAMVMKFAADGRWSDSEGSEGTWTADVSRSPKGLVLAHVAGRDRGKKQLCVFDVTGDSLTLVLGVPDGSEAERPTRLATTMNAQNGVLFVFSRMKSAK